MQPKADGRDKRGKFILLAAGLRSPVVGYTVQRKAIGICIQTRKSSFSMLDLRDGSGYGQYVVHHAVV